MLSLNGYFKRELTADPASFLQAMEVSGNKENAKEGVRHQFLCDSGGISAKSFHWREPASICAESTDADCTLLIHGELYDATPSQLLAAYLENDLGFLDSFDFEGVFVGIIIDRKKSKVLLFSDFFGLENLYYYIDESCFVFSSTIKNIVALPEVKVGVDVNTLVSFWNFGFPIKNQTPFDGIHLLPPASIVSIDLKNWQRKDHEYGHLTDIFNTEPGVHGSVDEAIDSFKHAVDIRSKDIVKNRLGLSLSGGLDSRAILAALGERGKHLTTYTLGLNGCADELLAERMAKVCGTEHSFIPIEETALKDFESLARALIYHSDGQYHPHESTEQVALNYLSSQPFDVMFRGHGGEIGKYSLAYPFQCYKHMETESTDKIFDHFFNSGSLAGHDLDFPVLFEHPIAQDSRAISYEALKASIQPALNQGIKSCDLGIYIYINQWVRRQVVSSLSIFRSEVGIRLPYLDKKFLIALLKLKPEQRYSGEFHRKLVHSFSPALIRIPDSNTGAPLDAGKLELFVKDKMNAVLRRLSIRGHRHYTEFHDWQRKHFSDSIKKILFSEQSLGRGFYSQEELERIFELHLSGKKDYSHFFGTAVGIELFHQLFVDQTHSTRTLV